MVRKPDFMGILAIFGVFLTHFLDKSWAENIQYDQKQHMHIRAAGFQFMVKFHQDQTRFKREITENPDFRRILVVFWTLF